MQYELTYQKEEWSDMKYVVLVGDGMADRPLKELGNKTCLQKADTPHMDKLAAEGEVGTARTVPDGFEPGSDVANLSILGYNPSKYYSGRAPIEAIYRGIPLGEKDVAFRCNLVTLNMDYNDAARMEDYSAGHISTKDARTLIRELDKRLGTEEIRFYPGMSYRHLMVWKNGKDKMHCTPPHDISGKKVEGYLPGGRGSEVLRSLMIRSREILLSNSVNSARMKKGLRPANSIWFWGQGRKLSLPLFQEKYNLKGALISAVDLTKGLGMSAGFDIVHVKGATGYIDTNYTGKARAALNALKTYDIVYVHVEAPDEAGHNGDLRAKLQAIEDFDKKVVGPVMDGVKRFGEFSIMLMPDHFTPIRVKTHVADPVPFVIFRSTASGRGTGFHAHAYSESICRMKKKLLFERGYRLMDYFVRRVRT